MLGNQKQLCSTMVESREKTVENKANRYIHNICINGTIWNKYHMFKYLKVKIMLTNYMKFVVPTYCHIQTMVNENLYHVGKYGKFTFI